MIVLTNTVYLQDKLCRLEAKIEKLEEENVLLEATININSSHNKELVRVIIENIEKIKKLESIMNETEIELFLEKGEKIKKDDKKYRERYVMYPWPPDDGGPRFAA